MFIGFGCLIPIFAQKKSSQNCLKQRADEFGTELRSSTFEGTNPQFPYGCNPENPRHHGRLPLFLALGTLFIHLFIVPPTASQGLEKGGGIRESRGLGLNER